MAPQLQHPGSQPAVGAAAADLAPAVHAGGAAPAAPAGHAERAEQPTAGHPAPGALGVAARTIARQQPQRALDQVQEPVEVEGDLFFDPLSGASCSVRCASASEYRGCTPLNDVPLYGF